MILFWFYLFFLSVCVCTKSNRLMSQNDGKNILISDSILSLLNDLILLWGDLYVFEFNVVLSLVFGKIQV